MILLLGFAIASKGRAQFATVGGRVLISKRPLEPDVYRPYPMIVSTTVVPLPVPQTSFVAIGSVLPFQDFDWSPVLKVGVTIWFVEYAGRFHNDYHPLLWTPSRVVFPGLLCIKSNLPGVICHTF